MAPPRLTFGTFRADIQAAFPELQDAYDVLAVNTTFGHAGKPGQYALTEMLFALYIEVLLLLSPSPRRNVALHKCFAFAEEMLASTDDEVAGLAQIGLIEGRQAWWFQRALPFVGPLWRQAALHETVWETALKAGPLVPPRLAPALTDLFGVRLAVARQLAPEGILLSEVPGITHMN